MKHAPKKIYVTKMPVLDSYSQEWSRTPYYKRENVEYIRKDAVVERLETIIKVMHSQYCEEDLKEFDAFLNPVVKMIKEM